MLNLFSNNKKSKTEIKGLTNSTVNIFKLLTNSEELEKILSLQNFDAESINIQDDTFTYDNAQLLLAEHVSPRESLINNIIEEWKSCTWIHIFGGYDTGKSQLSLLIKNKLDIEGVWLSLKKVDEQKFEKILLRLINKLLQLNLKKENEYLIILDDLPKLGLNDKISTLIVQLLNYCKENNIKLLSTSNYRIDNKIISIVSNNLYEFNIPLLDIKEIEEIIVSYTASNSHINYAISVLAISKGYPIYVQVICKYLEKKNWSLNINDFTDFLSGKAFYELTDETYYKLISTTEDEDTRELIYRINLISDKIDNETIKLVSEVEPKIAMPFEKLAKIKGTWIQQNEDQTYSISPLIERTGKENLSTDVVINTNNVLAEHILSEKNLNQHTTSYVIMHFINGKSYDKAGSIFISFLQYCLKDPDLFLEPTVGQFWRNTSLPNEMSNEIKVVIRSLQLYILNDVKISNSANNILNDRDYLREELINYLNTNKIDHINSIFPLLVLFKSYLLENASKAIYYFSSLVRTNKSISEFNLLESDIIINNTWALLHGLKKTEDLKIWFEAYALLDQPIEKFNTNSVKLFSRMLCEDLVNSSINHIDTLTTLDYIYDNTKELNLQILRAFAARSKINILCDKLDSLIVAKKYVNDIEQTFEDELALFLIKDELGRQQYYSNNKEDSLKTLLEIIDIDISYITKVDVYLTLSKIFGDKDIKLAHYYTLKAIEYSKTQIEITELSSIKLLCELGISQWFNKEIKEAIYTLANACERLLSSYKKIDSFDNVNDYNVTIIRIGSVLNYIYQVIENGVPPRTILNGNEYYPPKRGVFNSNYDSKLLNEWYFDERKFMNAYIFIRAFEFFNDKDNAIKWANIAFKINSSIELYSFKLSLRSILVYKVIQDEYQSTIDIENEILDYKKSSSEEILSKINNKQQQQIFLNSIEDLQKKDNFDNFHKITFHIVLTLLRKLQLLQSNKITKNELARSLTVYLNYNSSFFGEKESLESIVYLLENFPKNHDESIKMGKWINNLDIENIKLVQVIGYLICSFEARPFEALKFQLAMMSYLERILKGIAKGAYLFILYPLIYKFWTQRVIKEPSEFYFLELWQKNLKMSTEVKSEYKLKAIFSLVCMHLSYRPDEQEHAWMEDYILDVLKNN